VEDRGCGLGLVEVVPDLDHAADVAGRHEVTFGVADGRGDRRGRVDPVGARATVKVDIRLISATHRDLLQLVKDGKFREDLYYRLNVFPVQVPPLRARRDDIPELARHFIDRLGGRRDGRPVRGMSEDALDLLMAYDWPGNIRQFENAILRAVVLAEGDLLTREEFPQIRAEIEGIDATDVPARKRDVGFVFQHYAAFKHLSVARNIAFGLEIRKRSTDEIRTRVHELLRLVHLEQFADRLPSQLSGGQRQRMALARALAVEPTVLLLDEPFGALDAKVRKELREWLRRLHDEVPVTTVFVTHDQEEALEVADEIAVINAGRVEQIGTPDELYDQPANSFVMSFLGPTTTLHGELVRPHDIDIHATDPGDALPGTVVRVQRVGFDVRVHVNIGADDPVMVQLTRTHLRFLGITTGDQVWVRVASAATTARCDPLDRASLTAGR
jgi:sulfate transport system ATP-binding protein